MVPREGMTGARCDHASRLKPWQARPHTANSARIENFESKPSLLCDVDIFNTNNSESHRQNDQDQHQLVIQPEKEPQGSLLCAFQRAPRDHERSSLQGSVCEDIGIESC